MSRTVLVPSQLSRLCLSGAAKLCDQALQSSQDLVANAQRIFHGQQKKNQKQTSTHSNPSRLPSLVQDSVSARPLVYIASTNIEETNSPTSAAPSTFGSSSSRFLQEFSLLRWIGKGAFGRVCAAMNQLDCQKYAIKIVPLAMTDRSAAIAVQEVVTMASLPAHDNVVRYFGAWIEPLNGCLRSYLFNCSDIDDNVDSCSYSSATTSAAEPDHAIFIQMEYCGSKTLRDWLQNRTSVDTSETLSIARQLLLALEHIHKHGVVHRDVKPDNVFLHNGVAKLGDFGLSSFQSHHNSPAAGTASYAEPKQSNSLKSPKGSTDVFSLGMCLFEMFSLFDTSMERAICFGRARKGVFEAAFEQRFPQLASLLKQMLTINAGARPTCFQLLCDSVFCVSEPETDEQSQIRRLNEQLRARDDTIRSLRHHLAAIVSPGQLQQQHQQLERL